MSLTDDADDRLPTDPRGRTEGRDGIVEGRDGAMFVRSHEDDSNSIGDRVKPGCNRLAAADEYLIPTQMQLTTCSSTSRSNRQRRLMLTTGLDSNQRPLANYRPFTSPH